MKKLFAILLAVTMLASMATVASAASTTTLTTTVPAASYTLNIPADQEIPFGETQTNIGCVTVTDAAGFAVGKNLNVSISYDAFKCAETITSIPFYIAANGYAIQSNDNVTFRGLPNGEVSKNFYIDSVTQDFDLFLMVDSTDWGKALAGDYTATITFTAEVVAE